MPRNDGNTNKKEASKNTFKGNKNFNGKPADKKRNRASAPTVKATTATTKPFFAKQPKNSTGYPYEYKMSRLCANEILRNCPSTVKPMQYLCDYVTEQYGLMGWCQRVIIEG